MSATPINSMRLEGRALPNWQAAEGKDACASAVGLRRRHRCRYCLHSGPAAGFRRQPHPIPCGSRASAARELPGDGSRGRGRSAEDLWGSPAALHYQAVVQGAEHVLERCNEEGIEQMRPAAGSTPLTTQLPPCSLAPG